MVGARLQFFSTSCSSSCCPSIESACKASSSVMAEVYHLCVQPMTKFLVPLQCFVFISFSDPILNMNKEAREDHLDGKKWAAGRPGASSEQVSASEECALQR
ncbi:unnamed protein product [Sphagnum balticum]